MNDKNKYMIYLLPIRCVIFVLIFVAGSIITRQKIDDISNWWSIAASIVNIILILMLFFFAKNNNSSYQELINYQKGKTKVRQIIGISVLVLVVGMTGMYVAGYICYGIIPYAAPMMIAPIPVWLAVINTAVLPLTLILCGYYYKKRNPLPIIVGHAIIDVATALQILATSAIPGFYEMICGM